MVSSSQGELPHYNKVAQEYYQEVAKGIFRLHGKLLGSFTTTVIMIFQERTSPSIDPKVCNKKVAVDDRWDVLLGRGASGGGARRVKDPAWSCVDYEGDTLNVDTIDQESIGGVRPGRMNEFSARYRNTKRAAELRPDDNGIRRAIKFRVIRERDGTLHGIGKADSTSRVGTATVTTRTQQGDSTTTAEVKEHVWYINKQTNRGWPGTAEGKINTAQGMAGDLVSNLDDEEKATVAGILTRTVSGGEVVEIRAVSTTSVMLNGC
ncbi:hypothetical protein [Anaplasma platys]